MKAVWGGALEVEVREGIQLCMPYVGLRDTNHCSALAYKALRH